MTHYTKVVGVCTENCHIVCGNDGLCAVIDPGDEASQLLAFLKSHALTPAAVLLTHAHFDHIGALDAIMEAYPATLYCHLDEVSVLQDPYTNLTASFAAIPYTCKHPIHAVMDGDVIAVGDLSFSVIHTPGHTVGSCCYLTENSLFSGDTLFDGSVGRTDFPGGNTSLLRASLQKLFKLPDGTVVYPGHGDPTTIGHEKRTNPYR